MNYISLSPSLLTHLQSSVIQSTQGYSSGQRLLLAPPTPYHAPTIPLPLTGYAPSWASGAMWNTFESTETFTAVLTAIPGSMVMIGAADTATATITDDDSKPSFISKSIKNKKH